MSKAIERRVSAAERHFKSPTFEPTIIIVQGGLHGRDPMYATVGAQYLQRQPTESFSAFEARVIAIATVERKSFAVIGGMHADPDSSAPRSDGPQSAVVDGECGALSLDSGAWSQVDEDLDDL